MAIAPVKLVSGAQLGAASGTLYTATGNVKVTAPAFANTSASAVTLTVTITPSGGAVRAITPGVTIAANGVYLAPELSGQVLANGDVISAQASVGNVVNAFLSGIGGF